MDSLNASKTDRMLAAVCRGCVVCRHARKKQKGLAYRLVEKVETKTCPFCKAYERVYGKKAYEPWNQEMENRSLDEIAPLKDASEE